GYRRHDLAFKAVGVGSVGTLCHRALRFGRRCALAVADQRGAAIGARSFRRRVGLPQPWGARNRRRAHDAGCYRHLSWLDAKPSERTVLLTPANARRKTGP